MKLTVLGCAGSFPSADSACSAVISKPVCRGQSHGPNGTANRSSAVRARSGSSRKMSGFPIHKTHPRTTTKSPMPAESIFSFLLRAPATGTSASTRLAARARVARESSSFPNQPVKTICRHFLLLDRWRRYRRTASASASRRLPRQRRRRCSSGEKVRRGRWRGSWRPASMIRHGRPLSFMSVRRPAF